MLSGKDRGKTGVVLRTDPKERKMVVQGLNLVKRHMRARSQGQKGQIVSIERWVHAASVAFASKDSGKPARLGWRVSAGGAKVRIDRKTGIEIS